MIDVEIITPDRSFYTGKVSFIEMATTEGEIGVYENHVPTTCILAPGVVRLYEDENQTAEPKVAVVHAGFVEILKDRIRILAEIAEWPDEIDKNRAEEARIRAQRRIDEDADGVDLDRAELALKRALVRLSVKNK